MCGRRASNRLFLQMLTKEALDAPVEIVDVFVFVEAVSFAPIDDVFDGFASLLHCGAHFGAVDERRTYVVLSHREQNDRDDSVGVLWRDVARNFSREDSSHPPPFEPRIEIGGGLSLHWFRLLVDLDDCADLD